MVYILSSFAEIMICNIARFHSYCNSQLKDCVLPKTFSLNSLNIADTLRVPINLFPFVSTNEISKGLKVA